MIVDKRHRHTTVCQFEPYGQHDCFDVECEPIDLGPREYLNRRSAAKQLETALGIQKFGCDEAFEHLDEGSRCQFADEAAFYQAARLGTSPRAQDKFALPSANPIIPLT